MMMMMMMMVSARRVDWSGEVESSKMSAVVASADVPKKVETAAEKLARPPTEDERRAEIMAKLSIARASKAEADAKAAAGAQDMSKYGTHKGITCDGCSCAPITGFRWKCKNCKNHDICDTCHEIFLKEGRLVMDPEMVRLNKVSSKPEDHEFAVYTEAGVFQRMSGAGGAAAATEKKEKKAKPNDPCPGGCGQKVKKCACPK